MSGCKMSSRRWSPLTPGAEPSAVEAEVIRMINEVELNSSEEKRSEYAGIKICKAVEITVDATRKGAVLIAIPCPVHREFCTPKFVARFVEDLQKRLKKHVVVFAHRTILRKDTPQVVLNRMGLRRVPFSRTRSSVESRLISDMLCEAQIVGKRVSYRPGQAKLLQVYLDFEKRDMNLDKLHTYAAAFNHLTKKRIEFKLQD